MNFFSTVFSNCRANTLLIHALREYFTRGMNRSSFISRVKRAVLYVSTTLAYSSTRNEEFENEEFLVRKTDEKKKKMRDQKSSILEAFGGGNDRKFKIFFFSNSAKSTLK